MVNTTDFAYLNEYIDNEYHMVQEFMLLFQIL